VSATTISTTWANITLGDLATEISDSLSRSGKGGATAPIRTADGTVAAPAHAFTSEPASGLYKAGTGDVRLAVGGVDMLTPAGVAFPSATSPTVKSTGATTSLLLQGNRGAAEGFADVTIGSTATRTSGLIADFHNPIGVTSKLQVDYQGLLRLTTQAGPIQPASIYTAPTLDVNWAAVYGLAYWKDACGMVRFKGAVTNNTGGLASGIVSTTPLPAGFRPAAATFREFGLPTSAGTVVIGSVSAAGVVTLTANVANGVTVWLDPIAFPAEA
jgi:hypothetical protein